MFVGLPLSLPCIISSLSLHYPVFLLGQFPHHLGLFRPILFLWSSLAHFILSCFLHSHGLLLNFSDFPGPTPFTNSFFWAPSAHLCLLSTPYYSHGLTTSFFGASLSPFAFFGVLLLFCGPMYHYSNHSGLIVFFFYFANSSSLLPPILLGFFSLLGLLVKVGINNVAQYSSAHLISLGIFDPFHSLQLLTFS